MPAVLGVALSLAAAGAIQELQCSDDKCSSCKVAKSWDDGKCIGLGNQAPYHVSQKATAAGGSIMITDYKGGKCEGASTQSESHKVGECTFFTALIWTTFKVQIEPTKAVAPVARPSAMQCPGSCGFACAVHCGMKITGTANADCSQVQEEALARVAAQPRGWHDPHNNGTYTKQNYGGTMSFSRVTGNAKYTDKIIFTLTTSGKGCLIEACSESQVFSVGDMGTNYCDSKMLFCGSADGCKPVKHDFTISDEDTEKFAEATVDLKGCLKV